MCRDNLGSFRCECWNGYRLGNDGRSCIMGTYHLVKLPKLNFTLVHTLQNRIPNICMNISVLDFGPNNELLVQNTDTNNEFPILSLVITGTVSVGTSLLLVLGAMMLCRMASRRKRHANWSHWLTSPGTPSPLTLSDNSEYSSPNQSMDCDTLSPATIKL